MGKPSSNHPVETVGFRIASPCGRTYEVPLTKVRDDYAKYLMESDGITRAQALAQCDRETLETWFMEQFDWSDVERYGRVVKNPSPRQIREALDLMRGNDSPGNFADLKVFPEKVAEQRSLHLDKTLAPSTPSASPRKPRM